MLMFLSLKTVFIPNVLRVIGELGHMEEWATGRVGHREGWATWRGGSQGGVSPREERATCRSGP